MVSFKKFWVLRKFLPLKLNQVCFFTFLLCSFFLFNSCQVTFLNGWNNIPEEFHNIYLPSVVDESNLGGNSIRLSNAIRKNLAKRTDVNLVSIDNARIGLWIHILNRKQTIVSVDNCQNPGSPTVGSGAFACSEIHPNIVNRNDASFDSMTQPAQSANTESLVFTYQWKIIDLSSGEILFSEKATTSGTSFNEIGDNGDGRTLAYVQKNPQLHALRYQEIVDDTVKNIAESIAADMEGKIVTQLNKKYNSGK